MFRIVETSFSGFRVEPIWPSGLGVRCTLVLTDPDGQVQTDVVEWTADQDYPLRDVIVAFAALIEAMPHWRARAVNDEFRIGTADSDYSGTVSFEVL